MKNAVYFKHLRLHGVRGGKESILSRFFCSTKVVAVVRHDLIASATFAAYAACLSLTTFTAEKKLSKPERRGRRDDNTYVKLSPVKNCNLYVSPKKMCTAK